jgi:hypothetical protein
MEGVLFLKKKTSPTAKSFGIGGKEKQQEEADQSLGVNKAWDRRYCKVANKKILIYDSNYDTNNPNKSRPLDVIDLVLVWKITFFFPSAFLKVH